MKRIILLLTLSFSGFSIAGDACQISSLSVSSNYCYKITCAVEKTKDICTAGYPSQEELNKLYPRTVKYLIDAGFMPSGQNNIFIKK